MADRPRSELHHTPGGEMLIVHHSVDDFDPCPKGDPECLTGDDGSCHDACEAPDPTPGAYVGKPCPNCGAELDYAFPLSGVKVGRKVMPTLILSRYVASCSTCGWDEEAGA